MATSGIATRKKIRSLMDRPRDPMASPRFSRRRMRAAPRRIQLTVKGARIAHNRHRPELKTINPSIGQGTTTKAYILVLSQVVTKDDSWCRGAWRFAVAAFVGVTAYAR